MSASPTEQFADELRALAEDAGHFFQADNPQAQEATREMRNRLAETLQSAEKTLEALNQKAADGLDAADNLMRARPYKALGIALAVGVLIGLLAKKK